VEEGVEASKSIRTEIKEGVVFQGHRKPIHNSQHESGLFTHRCTQTTPLAHVNRVQIDAAKIDFLNLFGNSQELQLELDQIGHSFIYSL